MSKTTTLALDVRSQREAMMKKSPRVGAAVVFAVLSIASAHATDYPARPVKIITQGAAGSGPDVIARIIADHLGRAWGKQVLIVNHPGGGGVIAAQTAATADPDGYTLYIPTITTFVIMPEIQAKLAFDLDRDFVHVGFVGETPMMVAVAPSLGVDSLSDLIAFAKKRPGEILYAANNRGSLPHLTGELLRSRSGIQLTFIPYQGAAAGLQDLIGGRISMIVESVGALAGAIQGGSVRPIAVASSARVPNLPNVPTVAETIPGFAALGWFVLMAPARTPEAIVRKVNEDLNKILARPDLRQRFQELGAFVRPMSPAQTAEFIAKEQQVWRPLVRQIGLATQ
jgi:tripartite-type tricarboxylate transporter receptor subunit TctC